MAEFKLERFKYNWRGDWVAGTAYKRDDVVRVNGKSYVCLVTHTSNSLFRTDLTAILPGSNPPQPQPRWTIMTGGRSFEGDYTSGAVYELGDIVRYDGILWICTVPHTATGNPQEVAYWEVFADFIADVGSWQTATTYGPGAIVKYNGIRYKCITPHVSGSLLEDNINDWEVFLDGIEYVSDWTPVTSYRKNDLVKYGGTIFRCIESHTSGSTNLSNENFQVEIFGTQFNANWNSSVYYNIGDIVRHRGYMYYAIENNIDAVPYVDGEISLYWILLAKTYYFAGAWNVSGEYKTGDVVLRGGNLYLALRDIGANTQDGSTLDYLDDNTWELLVPGKKWVGLWNEGTRYSEGAVVYYKGSAYSCNFEHVADLRNRPGDNGNGFEYWDTFIEQGTPAALQYKGDLLTYGASRELDGVEDTSTLGLKRIPIGEREQLLSINSDLEAYWRDIVQDADSIYVSTNGIDDFGRGTFQKPFKTIRYACEYVEDNFPAGTPVIVRVSAGRFEEIAPIIVPAGCAVNGDELRSTTVIASPAKAEYSNDLRYVRQYLTRLELILLSLVSGIAVTPTSGNTAIQITIENIENSSTIINFPVKLITGFVIDPETGQSVPVTPETVDEYPVSNISGAARITSLYNTFLDYIEFRVESGDTDPTLTGTNTITENQTILNAANSLELNKVFIREELLAYVKATNPNVTFNDERVRSDIWALLRGIIRDMRYTGNYGTLIAARRYTNATLGSQSDDLFRLRDSTGLRDCTTGGLQGVLQPPQVFELYQRPTGGACVAFDPGWGPNDDRTWITNRSPYIQGVTNTGTGCVGKRLDGSLHNGGLKSMVSNDFTQVLSDGVGVWVSDNARTELVSVFTYYCQIGYFAEDGGTIRATNGNNSYGRYGAIADGSDDTETPQSVTVTNRNNEARVISAFAGGTVDEILAFEYTNAGQNYTQASATIVGSGSNASVEYTDFRNRGIFEARLTKALDDSGSKGGSGYLTRQGSAQETLGASSTIKLSANDVTLDISEILGMRILITGGTGVGQYGIVNSFNFINKEVSVLKESTGTAGWDHIIPGTPIATNLDLTTRYRIEPRVTVSHPGFSTDTTTNLFANRTYVGLEYNNTKEIFIDVSGATEIPWLDDNGNAVTIDNIVSSVAIQFTGVFATNPEVPFQIRGDTSGAITNISAITANVSPLIEADITGGGNSFLSGETLTIILVAGTGETYDDDPVPATFDIIRTGSEYTVEINSAGAGYVVGDQILISGSRLGGSNGINDLTITVTGVSDDSTAGILSITHVGSGRDPRFVALTNAEYAQWSDNGLNWTETSLSFIGDYRALISSDQGLFVAVANNTNRVSTSLDGETWTTVNLPITASWTDGTYGNGRFVLVADDTSDVLVSTNGSSWTVRNIPDDIGGDTSTISQWNKVVYGKGIFLAVSKNDFATAISTNNGTTWTRNDEVLPNLTPDFDLVDLAYGDNRFIALDSQGRVAYSFDGVIWYEGSTAPGGLTYRKIKYSNGVFFAIGLDGSSATNVCATTEDGLRWTQRATLNSQRWGDLTYGIIDSVGTWVLLANAVQTNAIEHIHTGKQAKLRADVLQGSFKNIKIWDPGSGYNTEPTLTVIDPNSDSDIFPDLRIGDNVLAQPDFINRGSGYRTSTSTISILGNGYADIIPEGNILVLQGVSDLPGPGVQIRISGILNLDTEEDTEDLKVFSGVEITDLGDDGSGNGTRIVSFVITPSLKTEYAVQHGTAVTLRERYSQCRITGHDFLDIGTGNFEETNYPEIYAGGRFFVALPENEVFESNGGRVFYTSTDQDGNFRTGELFAVNQATGIVTISAQFFDLDGLTELALGGVRLGGSGTVVNEFSTDNTFAADSNNVIPTQRAIATFLANRLSIGGENLEVNRIVAGRIGVGGFQNNIENVTTEYIVIPADVRIQGIYTDEDEVERSVGIQGTIVSQMLFLKKFNEDMQ